MTSEEFEIQYALGSLDEDTLIGLADETKSEKILVILSNDKDWYIRYRVAKRISTSTNILRKLAEDEDWDAKDSAVNNPNWEK